MAGGTVEVVVVLVLVDVHQVGAVVAVVVLVDAVVEDQGLEQAEVEH